MGTQACHATRCPEPIRRKEDVNGDDIVNIQDLVWITSNLGQSGSNPADVNGDGIVNIQDLVLVAGALGASDSAPAVNPQALQTFIDADVEKWLQEARQLSLTDPTFQRGILILEQLLATLTRNRRLYCRTIRIRSTRKRGYPIS